MHRINSKPKGKWCCDLADIIREKLLVTWSPEQIANTDLLSKVTFKTIYCWLYNGKILGIDHTVLRQKGKRQKPTENRGKAAVEVSIFKRPSEVEHRDSFGHWELDTMVSSRGKSKGCFATFLERKSRLYTALKIPDRTATSMEDAICQLHLVLPAGSFKTGTTDRGKEFSCYATIRNSLI